MDTPAPIPINEEGRLEALRGYNVLDTPREADFEDLAELAAYICGTPMSAISLIDVGRQWFKASVGLNVSETPRNISFCQHAVMQDGLMIVPDARADMRFEGSPLVTGDPNIRFYAGAPLQSPDGHNIGVLCVKDTVPRSLTEQQQLALTRLARLVMVQLEIRKVAKAKEEQAELLEVKLKEADDARSSLLESELRLKSIAANVPGLVFQVVASEAGWRFTYLSSGVIDVFGVSADTFLEESRRILDFIHPEDRLSFVNTTEKARVEYSAWSWHGRVIDELGNVKWVEGSSKPQKLRPGAHIWDGVIIDVTSRKVQDELTAARVDAERANKAKSEFLSRMSHELRTPLNAILGFAQLIEMQAPPGLDSESLSQILSGGRHLLNLINEILDISRIDAGAMLVSLEPVNLVDVTREAMDMMRPRAHHTMVEMAISFQSTPVFVTADSRRLKQVLLNLLSNAVKYNRPGGRVDVSIDSSDTGEIRLYVSDTGLGIPLEHVHRIFTPFDRLGAEVLRVEGTGLGLSLSKRLAETMQGSLELAENSPSGCSFVLALKQCDPAPQSEAPQEPARAARSFRATVLCIEDNMANVELAKSVFSMVDGVTMEYATTHHAGLAAARDLHPDIILLDLDLPDMDGMNTLTALKADPLTQAIPVIIVSADATGRRVNSLRAAGAVGYISKPYDVDELLTKIEQLVEKAARVKA